MQKEANLMRIFLILTLTLWASFSVAGEAFISEKTFAGTWPFVVAEGTIKCEAYHHVSSVTFITTAGEFAVNGIASGRGFPEIDPIWLDNDEIPGAKIRISDIIKFGLSLCD